MVPATAGVPWRELSALLESYYPKAGNGRRPVGLERRLRIYFPQPWFNRSDPAVEEALYDSPVMRQFGGRELRRQLGLSRTGHGLPSQGRTADAHLNGTRTLKAFGCPVK
jgi:hypothetical protein